MFCDIRIDVLLIYCVFDPTRCPLENHVSTLLPSASPVFVYFNIVIFARQSTEMSARLSAFDDAQRVESPELEITVRLCDHIEHMSNRQGMGLGPPKSRQVVNPGRPFSSDIASCRSMICRM